MSMFRRRLLNPQLANGSGSGSRRGPLAFSVLFVGATFVLLHPKAIHVYRSWWHAVTPASHDAGGYVAHSICYATLAAVGVMLLPRTWHVLFYAALLLHGVATEFMQQFIPGRTFDPKDIVCNVLAATVAFVAASAWSLYSQPRETTRSPITAG